ncbi:MAG: hypothetical protein U5J95_01995 [Balneolaceae bacterium]|nr:hypothetical protein [Balneolaceae bacterium]
MKTFKNRSRITYTFLFSLVVLFVGTPALAQQNSQSDYEIVQSYKNQYKSLNKQVDNARSAKQVEELIKSIKQFDRDFEEHKDLLNKVIHPENYASQLKALQKSALTTQERLTTIEEQDRKLQKLSNKLVGYDQQLQELSSKTDSLQLAIQKSIKSEKQLSTMVRKYRKSLEKRDDLILSFVDSVMIAYQKLNISSIQDLENAQKKARFEANGNALNMIKNIAQENIQFLASNPKLSTEEYLRMNAVQQQFQDMWNKVGDKLTEIYVEDNAANVKKEVNASIKKWDMEISSRTWKTLNEAIDEEGIDMPKFTNQQTFYNTLNSYLENSFQSSKDDRSQKTYANYQRFYSFWTNDVQMNWSPYIERGHILSSKQLASIDRKVDQWASIAEPKSNLLLYLFGASVLAIVVLGVVLIREKAK